jgi:HAD superfamily hydrolase (TIGR01458 family)
VGRRRRGRARPRASSAARRSSASSRFRDWLRSSWETARTTVPSFSTTRLFWAVLNVPEASTSKTASTRVSVFWACWPPGPLEREKRSSTSLSGIASARVTRIESLSMTAILLDIDGVLHVSGEAIPGAADAVGALRGAGHRLRFVTNNTTRARARLAAELRAIGIEVEADEVATTALAAGKMLEGLRVLPLTMDAIHDDLARHVTLVDSDADAVLIGGADETAETERVFAWTNLNRAFRELRDGARLVCLHKNGWWQTAAGPLLDSGGFVAGLEYAAGVDAEVVGKPTAAYFEAALADLGTPAAQAVMVGDDVASDVGGAKAVGMRGVLVRTGKFRKETLEAAEPKPDAVLDSIADLPGYLAA